MEQEEIGLALGLSLGSGRHQLKEQPPSHPPCELEPSLSLSLPADDGGLTPPARRVVAGVKRELPEEDDDEAADRGLFSAVSSAVAADDDEGCNSRKKLRLTKVQSALLEERFKEHSTLNPKQKVALAKQLNLRPRQVEVWFQNRRARTKLKQTEVDCDLLKRCCETLTEENRRLHRELQQLRALSHSPQPAAAAAFFMPAAALSICPSCERIAGAPAAATAATDRSKAAAGPAGRAAHLFSPFTRSAAC